MNRKRRSRGRWVIIGIVFIFLLIYYQSVNKKDITFPTALHPVVEEQSNILIQRMAEKGITVVITDSFRSAEEQDALYSQGRTTDGNIVTYAKGGESLHNFGLAVDFALKTDSGAVIWDMEYDGNGNGSADWMEVVETAKELGFEWGGDWVRFKDYPHLQMDFGLSLTELQNGKTPRVK